MRAQLISLDDGMPVDIEKDLTLVGRGENCDLQLVHKSVSKLHCVIVRTDGLLLIRDLGSTNGTRVNGERVRRAALLPNDKLNIASLRFRVHLGPDEAEPVGEHERTQNIDGEELRRLLKAGGAANDDEDDSHYEMPDVAVRQNDLPDGYDDKAKPPEAKGKPKR